jgi:transcriptional regulator with XRE-family HTH domain
LQPLDAERVKEWRHRRMLSQQEVADRAGTSLFTIQRIERGEGNVRPKTGRGVAAALGIPIEELLPKAQAPLFRGLPEQEPAEEWRESRFAMTIANAAKRWGEAMADTSMDNDKRSGLINAALDMSDLISEQVNEEDWETLTNQERREILATMEQLGAAAERGLNHLEQSLRTRAEEQSFRERREQIRQWTQQISA